MHAKRSRVKVRSDPSKMVWALLKITAECDSACSFCHRGGSRPGAHLPLEEVLRRALDARDHGCRGVLLSGGEPTRHPEIGAISRAIHGAGLALGVVTNGIGFERALRAQGLRVEAVHVSLHGSRAEVHEAVTCARSFAPACRALDLAVEDPSVEVTVNSVVVRENLHDLDALVDLVTSIAGRRHGGAPVRHRLTALEPKGRAAGDPASRPGPLLSGAAVAHALAAGNRRHGAGVVRGWDGFAYCHAPASLLEEAHLTSYDIEWIREMDEARLFRTDRGARAWPPRCSTCSARTLCHGLFAGDLEAFGDTVRPFGEERPTAPRYVVVGETAAAPGSACPVRLSGGLVLEGKPSRDAAHRALLVSDVRLGPGRALLAVADDSVPAPSLVRNRDAHDRVFVRRRGAAVQLALERRCIRCSTWGRCPGLRAPDEGQPSAPRVTALETLARDLRGEVLILDSPRGGAEVEGLSKRQGTTLRRGGLDDAPATAIYDAIVAQDLFEQHVEIAPNLILRRVAGLLREGGTFAVMGKVRLAEVVDDPAAPPARGASPVTDSTDLIPLLHRAGLSVERVEAEGRYWSLVAKKQRNR